MIRARASAACPVCQRAASALPRRFAATSNDPVPPKLGVDDANPRSAGRLVQRSKALRHNLEQRLVHLSTQFSKFTGYEHIESLKGQVEACEISLLEARAESRRAKAAYEAALDARRSSQRESNDLLQRKSRWNDDDVSRYTDLVRRDHLMETEARDAQQALSICEESVEKGFSALMSAILARYHEEQVWSDKIRSVSTYGSLAITAANVVVFLLAIVVVEPWRRNRLIEGVESRLHERETERAVRSEEGLTSIVDRLDQAESKLDHALARVVSPRASTPPSAMQPDPADLNEVLKQLMATDEVDELDSAEGKSKRWQDLLLASVGGAALGALSVAAFLWR